MPHPRHRLDDAFQTPIRLSLMAALGAERELDFRTLRELLESDDSVLSKAVATLERAGYVKVTKGHVGNRPRTWVRTSAKGMRAYREHLAALQAITRDALHEDRERGDRHGDAP